MTIKTKPATDDYRDGYDRVFSKKQPLSDEAQIIDRVADAMLDGFAGKPMPGFQRATIKVEGGVADPADCDWDFRDPIELATYKDWKAQFDAEQDRLYGITK